MKPEVIYREEQKLPVQRIAVALLIPPAIMTLLCIWQVALGHKWKGQAMSNSDIIFWTVFLWLVYLRLMTVRLVTEVRGAKLRVRLRGIFRRRTISLADVRAVDPGIEVSYRSKPWVAQGSHGVAITLAGGEKVIIGSQKPNELAAVILGRPESSATPPHRKPGQTR